jgi:hypothetical protein
MPKRDKNTKEITKNNNDSGIYSRLHDASNNKQRKPTTNTQNGASLAIAKKKPNSASMMLLLHNFKNHVITVLGSLSSDKSLSFLSSLT